MVSPFTAIICGNSIILQRMNERTCDEKDNIKIQGLTFYSSCARFFLKEFISNGNVSVQTPNNRIAQNRHF